MSESPFWQSPQSFLGFLKQLLLAHWQSLLLLFVGVVLPLFIFEQLAIVIWRNQGGFPWDTSILLAIHATARPYLDTLAENITDLGTRRGVFPIAVVIALVLLRLKLWRSLTYLLTVQIGSALISATAKGLLHRVRPQLWDGTYPLPSDFAFPSGHAMASMTLVMTLLVLLWGSRWRWLVLSLGSLFVVAIAWTRLYLGVHFPSDILAGWLVAIAWAIGVSLLIKPQLTQPVPVLEETLTVEEEAIVQE